jgi:hypothetical protein
MTNPQQTQMSGVAYFKYTSTLKKLSDSRLSKTAGSFPSSGTRLKLCSTNIGNRKGKVVPVLN